MSASILLVDDDPVVRETLDDALRLEGYRVTTVESGEEALAQLAQQEFDVIVSDIVMPGVGGLDVLERSRALNPRAVVILMTAYASVPTATAALRRGAFDYLEKPFPLDDLKQRVQHVLEHRELIWKERLLHRMADQRSGDPILVGESSAIRTVREQIVRTASIPSNVLITGESGVGKELVARAVHAASSRRDRPFVPVNCAAIPEMLLESQLFGHVRGAFTSAVQANPGLFVVANGGTLLLDEIGEMAYALQAKLLRVIEERTVWPVGATKAVPVDVRIIASTHRDLPSEIEARRFREDLFYRLDVVHIKLPPLRERRADIPLLIDHLVQRLNAKLGTAVRGVDPDAVRSLVDQPWKGNVRELENVLERAMVLGTGEMICLADLAPAEIEEGAAEGPDRLRDAVQRFERQHIMHAIAQAGFDKRAAARLLGISLASLYRKLNVGARGDSGAMLS